MVGSWPGCVRLWPPVFIHGHPEQAKQFVFAGEKSLVVVLNQAQTATQRRARLDE
jgi:hypothetical protein